MHVLSLAVYLCVATYVICVLSSEKLMFTMNTYMET